MLTTEQIEALAQQLVEQYDYPALWAGFSWGGETMPDAWITRERLVPEHRIRDAAEAAEFAESVHRWGFGGKGIRSSIIEWETWPLAIYSLAAQWQLQEDPIGRVEALCALEDLLSIPNVGIATATKWVCFLDQDRFAIYDSRVSYAMRRLTVDNLRVFPFVGARVSDGERPNRVSQDACLTDPKRSVTAYSNFLSVIRRTARLLNSQQETSTWNAAKIECCMFVAGESRLREPGLVGVNNSINAPRA